MPLINGGDIFLNDKKDIWHISRKEKNAYVLLATFIPERLVA